MELPYSGWLKLTDRVTGEVFICEAERSSVSVYADEEGDGRIALDRDAWPAPPHYLIDLAHRIARGAEADAAFRAEPLAPKELEAFKAGGLTVGRPTGINNPESRPRIYFWAKEPTRVFGEPVLYRQPPGYAGWTLRHVPDYSSGTPTSSVELDPRAPPPDHPSVYLDPASVPQTAKAMQTIRELHRQIEGGTQEIEFTNSYRLLGPAERPVGFALLVQYNGIDHFTAYVDQDGYVLEPSERVIKSYFTP